MLDPCTALSAPPLCRHNHASPLSGRTCPPARVSRRSARSSSAAPGGGRVAVRKKPLHGKHYRCTTFKVDYKPYLEFVELFLLALLVLLGLKDEEGGGVEGLLTKTHHIRSYTLVGRDG